MCLECCVLILYFLLFFILLVRSVIPFSYFNAYKSATRDVTPRAGEEEVEEVENTNKMSAEVLRLSAVAAEDRHHSCNENSNKTCNRATQTFTRKEKAIIFGRSLVGKKAVFTKAIVERWHKRKGRKVRP